MRKRLLALSLVLAFAVALVVPSFAADAVEKTGSSMSYEGGLVVPVEGGLRAKVATAVSIYYASLDYKTTDEAKAPKWTEIKADKQAVDGTIDLSAMLKKATATSLIFTTSKDVATKNASLTSVVMSESTSKLTFGGKMAVFDKAGVKGPKPPALSTYADNEDGNVYASITSFSNKMEWTYANSTDWSTTLPDEGIVVMPYPQEVWFRVAGTATTLPSAYVTVKIAALSVAPALKLDFAKGLVGGLKTGMLISEDGMDKGIVLGTKPTMAVGTTTKLASVTSIIATDDTFCYKIASTAKKPGSAWTHFGIPGISVSDSAPVDSDFSVTDKGIFYKGNAPIQVYIPASGNKAATWKTVKSIPAKKEAEITALKAGVKIRLAGTKAAWASPEMTLKLANGELVEG